jgi:hypothetical protein
MVTAVLRDESGATIGDNEFARDKSKYFPRYGDGPEQLREKTERRAIQIEAMKKKAGPALQESAAPSGAVTVNEGGSTEGDIYAEAQAAIAAGADPAKVMERLKQMSGK